MFSTSLCTNVVNLSLIIAPLCMLLGFKSTPHRDQLNLDICLSCMNLSQLTFLHISNMVQHSCTLIAHTEAHFEASTVCELQELYVALKSWRPIHSRILLGYCSFKATSLCGYRGNPWWSCGRGLPASLRWCVWMGHQGTWSPSRTFHCGRTRRQPRPSRWWSCRGNRPSQWPTWAVPELNQEKRHKMFETNAFVSVQGKCLVDCSDSRQPESPSWELQQTIFMTGTTILNIIILQYKCNRTKPESAQLTFAKL